MISSGRWVRSGEDPYHLTAYGIGLFRRDVTDGKFYSVATVPLVPQREKGLSSTKSNKKSKKDTESFLSNDGGLAWYQSMQGASNVVLQEVERACIRAAADICGDGCNNNNNRLEASIHVYGSHALGASLPAISDLDTVVQLRAKTSTDDDLIHLTSSSEYLQAVSARLEYLHRTSRIRMRVSSAGGTALYILTIKLSPQYPSLDILLCRMDSSGKPIDKTSQTAYDTLKDTEAVLESVRGAASSSVVTASDMKYSTLDVYQGALRIIKVWSDRRQICGANLGFLGGGGWAILLAWTLEQTNWKPQHGMSLTEAIHGLVRHFFENILRLWSNAPRGVAALSNSIIDPFTLEDASEIASSRGSMAVMAPRSGGNFGRSTSASTTRTTWDEIRNVQNRIMENGENFDLEQVLDEPYDISKNIIGGGTSLILALGLDMKNKRGGGNTSTSPERSLRPAEVKAWGATRLLNIIVALERKIGSTNIRPSSQVIKKKNGSFWFAIAITTVGEKNNGVATNNKSEEMNVLNEFIDKQRTVLEEECKIAMRDLISIQLSHMTTMEYNSK